MDPRLRGDDGKVLGIGIVQQAHLTSQPHGPLHLSNSHVLKKGKSHHRPRAVRIAPVAQSGWAGLPPRKVRGMTRRKAQLQHSRVSLRLAKAFTIRASPFGAPSRLFCSRDRASGYWAGLMKVLRSGQAFARLHPHPSSRFRQSPVVGPDGYPGPPGCVAANHTRGRRILAPPQDAS